MTDELKPCPFCGGQNISFIQYTTLQLDQGVTCRDCMCSAISPDRWNTRTDTITPPDALVRAVLDAAAGLINRVAEAYSAKGDKAIGCGLFLTVGNVRALADDPDFIARIIKAAEVRG